jgi:hypothetical protein
MGSSERTTNSSMVGASVEMLLMSLLGIGITVTCKNFPTTYARKARPCSSGTALGPHVCCNIYYVRKSDVLGFGTGNAEAEV